VVFVLLLGAERIALRSRPLIGTGTDITTVMPQDYQRAGLGFDAFSAAPTAVTTGVGGSAEVRRVSAFVLMADRKIGKLYRYPFLLNVAPPAGAFRRLPSLLGRDVTDQFRLIIDPTNDFVALDDPELYR
jgi:hypothetical protein